LRRRFANEDVLVPLQAIVFYGDNDIAKGQSAADIADPFRQSWPPRPQRCQTCRCWSYR
jgi:hypothetical protein